MTASVTLNLGGMTCRAVVQVTCSATGRRPDVRASFASKDAGVVTRRFDRPIVRSSHGDDGADLRLQVCESRTASQEPKAE